VRFKSTAFTVGLVVLLTLAGCGSDRTNEASSQDDQPAASVTQPPASPAATTSADGDAREIVGTIVRFSSNSTSVDVTTGEDNPAVRDFLSMLPLTLTVEEFAGERRSATSRASSGTAALRARIRRAVT
jgi:hypothetical protein